MSTPSAISSTSGRTLTCERCGTAFGCTLDATNCWCAEESYRMPMPVEGADCLCPDCLRAAATQMQRPA